MCAFPRTIATRNRLREDRGAERRGTAFAWEGSVERRPLTVAIIEDDPSMRKSIERLLNAYGFAAMAFASAEAFLERQADDAFACAVLDVHLPGMNGFELKRRMMAAGTELPIIFVTAIDDDDVKEYATQAGCVAYLRKPFAPDRLLDAVKSAIADR